MSAFITRNARKTHQNTKINKIGLDTERTLPRPPTPKITKINEIHEKGDRGGRIEETGKL